MDPAFVSKEKEKAQVSSEKDYQLENKELIEKMSTDEILEKQNEILQSLGFYKICYYLESLFKMDRH